ncbi:MAG: PD-(D/E)XK nuclease family protein [Desulfotomaculales bacterium]
MRQIGRQLAEVCRQYPFAEKVLICSNYSSGLSLREGLALQGSPWLNLRVSTVDGLALATAEPALVKKGLSVLPDIKGYFLMENVFTCIHFTLEYFNVLEPRPGIIGALYRAVCELRLAGVGPDGLSSAAFTSEAKRRDLVKILGAYQEALSQNRAADLADVYRSALDAIVDRPRDGRLFLVPADNLLKPHQKAFLERLAGDNLVLLRAAPVYGLPRPRFARPVEGTPGGPPANNVESLPWLYAQDRLPRATAEPAKDGSVKMFTAVAEHNETAEVLRRIRSEKPALDQVCIAYTSADYVWHLYRLATRLGLPVTFGDGIPFLLTRPGKGLSGLLRWIEGDFQAAVLRELLLEGLVKLGEETPGPVQCAEILRRSGVCWGRSRYRPCLEQLALSYEERSAGPRADDAGSQDCRPDADLCRNLTKRLLRLLEIIPEPDENGLVSLGAMAGGLARFLDEFAATADERDEEARREAREHFALIAEVADFYLPLTEALERLKRETGLLFIGPQTPRPGHIHVCHYSRAPWPGRRHTFVVGLDAARFPGTGTECPVLLDVERASLSPALSLARERPGEALYSLVQFLGALDGTVTLSYSNFDIVGMRPCAPAAVLLQVFRLITRNPAADYRTFHAAMHPPAGFVACSGEALDSGDWWLQVFADKGPLDPQVVGECYPWLERGRRALAARRSTALTAYDGKIEAPPERFDPRLNREIISASQIEELARCPFRYFLSCVLGLEPPADRPLDPARWLDPLEYGTLMHKIFCLYYRRLRASGRPYPEQDENLLFAIAGDLIGRMLEIVPPPSEVVLAQEKRGIYRSLRAFLRAEEENRDKSRPLYYEVPFGLGPEAVREAGLGLPGPVTLHLPDGSSVKLRGKIDRLDETDHGYLVLDYKTGSHKTFREEDYVRRGRQLQHALYAIAAEEILRREGKAAAVVPEAGYYFATEKGDGWRVLRSQANRAEALRAAKLLFDLLRNGTFVVAEDGDACVFCDYGVVCGKDVALAGIRAKLEAGANPLLEVLKEAAGIV